ncbi:hypothetical protein IWZ00DRAFT_131234 [Phyllosticta capitalensis]|uniref:uncharacterized protein n=1 Tax=Phyllosticta capitalensis TaxID=121624 RepID=UPI00313235D6
MSTLLRSAITFTLHHAFLKTFLIYPLFPSFMLLLYPLFLDTCFRSTNPLWFPFFPFCVFVLVVGFRRCRFATLSVLISSWCLWPGRVSEFGVCSIRSPSQRVQSKKNSNSLSLAIAIAARRGFLDLFFLWRFGTFFSSVVEKGYQRQCHPGITKKTGCEADPGAGRWRPPSCLSRLAIPTPVGRSRDFGTSGAR